MGGPTLDRAGEQQFDVRAIHETMVDDIVLGARLVKILEHRGMTLRNDRFETVEERQELLASLDHALLMERHVETGDPRTRRA